MYKKPLEQQPEHDSRRTVVGSFPPGGQEENLHVPEITFQKIQKRLSDTVCGVC